MPELASRRATRYWGREHNGWVAGSNYHEAFAYFQYRLDEWKNAIETKFRFSSTGERSNRWNQDIRRILQLRACNLRITVARLYLFNNEMRTAIPPDIWESLVDVAEHTGQLLAIMDGSPTTSRFSKAKSNYFLIAALSICLLAVAQYPPPRPPQDSAPNARKKLDMTTETYLKSPTDRDGVPQHSEYAGGSVTTIKVLVGEDSRLSFLLELIWLP